MRIADVTTYLESIAPPLLQEPYDNSGLLTGNGEDEVTGILFCLDTTEDALDEAIAKKCNLIISHHPILFTPMKKITGDNYIERVIIKAIKNNLAIYAIHTNLDNIAGGVNKKIAEKLELTACSVLSPMKNTLKKLVTFAPVARAEIVRNALFEAGAGHIGNYDNCSFNVDGKGTFRGNEESNPFVGEKGKDHSEPETRIEVIFPAYAEKQILAALFSNHPYEQVAYDIYSLSNAHPELGAGMIGKTQKPIDEKEFLEFVRKKMNAAVIRHTALLGKKIEKVAFCGGSGSFLLPDAIAAGADIFITADFKYHQFFDADGRIVIADIGHYESEQFTPELLMGILREKFPTFALHLNEKSSNPVNYY